MSLRKNRKYLIITFVIVLCLAAVAWRGRFRLRALLSELREEQARATLELPSAGSLNLPPAPPLSLTAGDWPWWRGVHGDNHSDPLPVAAWSETQNVLWKTALPGRGHSSPCVCGDQIFLTTSLDDQQLQQVLAVDRRSGELAWQTTVHQGTPIYSNTRNSHASSSVATDGHQLFAAFAVDNSIWLSSLDRQGNLLWQREIGPYVSKEGYGASPVIVGDVVIVAADCIGRSWLAAIHRTTGDTVWRISRGAGTSYASPVVIDAENGPLIVMAGLNFVTAYRPADGTVAWQAPGPDMSASTPVRVGDALVVTGCTADSGLYGVTLAEPKRVIWQEGVKVEVPSPLACDGNVYFVQDVGIVMCYDAASGDRRWRHRLPGTTVSSPLLAGGQILVCTEEGHCVVFEPGAEYREVADNQLDDAIYATPVVSDGQLLIRGLHHLYCIGLPDASSVISDRSHPSAVEAPTQAGTQGRDE
ncbi:MAG: PQQ-binding-like beta-propeller repeat protein [Planctomycetaceae bacterium]|nr:PQQ-binding-like beta-propeller repeat protein [Planctomycetaceae bacterium]